MGRVSIMELCDGIADTFRGLSVVLNAGTPAVTLIVQSYSELTEGQQDTPTIQVMPNTSQVDAATETDRTTFRGCTKAGQYFFSVRGFARPRSQLGEDMEASVKLWDALEAVLEDEGTACRVSGGCTFFGLPAIKAISWTGSLPQVWNYGGVEYVGFEMLIGVRVF